MQKQDKNQPLAVRLARSLASSGATSLNDPKFAAYLDSCDQLAQFRDNFSFPKRRTVWPQEYTALKEKLGEADDEDAVAPCVYLAGNSLGLMPKRTPELLSEELNVWAASGVLGHNYHAYNRSWIKIDETVTPVLAEMVGAKPSEVACMGSLTGNLHTLFTSFYRPTPQRHKIMYEGKAFPSDAYAFASHVALHDYPPSSLLPVFPREGEFSIRTEDILRLIEEEGDSIAVICFGAVQYYNGEWFDMEKITKAGHAKGCIVGFDCAHAAGNVPLKLHDWGVDFACWCSYKYLNSGPGGIAGLFVHERWEERKRLTGWWGHNKETRFSMPETFSPLPGAAGWQFSNPSVLDVVSLLASLQIFEQAANYLPRAASGGQIESRGHILGALREKSVDLTGYLELLLTSSPYFVPSDRFPPAPSSSSSKHASIFTIITPSEPSRRGCQLSLLFSPEDSMDWMFDRLREKGVLGDERRPGVIRFGPTPLYNSWTDVNEAARALDECLKEYGAYKRGLEGQGVERLQLDDDEEGSSIGTGYDLSTSTYSPDGRIFQVEYAGKAVENSGTVIGLRCKDGVVLAVEKLVLSKLLVPGANRRIASVDLHAGVATAGLLADGRHLAGRARDECESYRENYHTRVPTKILAERLAMYFQAYTLYSSVRPFGLSALVAGWDAPAAIEGSDTLVERRSEGKPALYMVEPSGTFWGYRGIAIGKGRQLAKTEIEKLPLDTLTAEEALVEAARIIHTVHDDTKDKDFELEMTWISPKSGWRHQPVPQDLADAAEKKAKEIIDAANEMEE
ncbi:hypothetical protein JCM1840_005639 [Sporobolomyces johnsonii]